MKNNFTRQEVETLLTSLIVFSNSNDNQGLKNVKGKSFGEKVEHIIACFETTQNTDNRILTMVGKFRG